MSSDKEQDKYQEHVPFFGKLVPFEDAFPELNDVSVISEQTYPTKLYNEKTTSHNGRTSNIICKNPLCFNGRIELSSIIREMINNKEKFKEIKTMCHGSEGSPKGRRIYRTCINFITIKITLEYKQNDENRT